jgi:hypothetical protein
MTAQSRHTVKYTIDPESQHKFDLEKAKFHLKKAGMENLRVDFLVADAAFAGASGRGLVDPRNRRPVQH